MLYKYDGEVFERFDEAAHQWVHYWGSGGGCLSIETTLKDVEGATREEWEKEARDCWLACEMQPCAVNDVIDAILFDIEEVEVVKQK